MLNADNRKEGECKNYIILWTLRVQLLSLKLMDQKIKFSK